MEQIHFEYNGEWGTDICAVVGPMALGRNGYVNCRGFTLMKYKRGNAIRVYPITSKGADARCFMEVPIEHVDEFIKKLQRVKEAKKHE